MARQAFGITSQSSSRDAVSGRVSRRVSGVVGMLLLAVSLGACSMIQAGYGWLPTAVNWRLSSYFTATPEQQTRIDEHLDSLFEWHRSVELPRYAVFLESVAGHAAGAHGGEPHTRPTTAGPAAQGVTVGDLDAWRERARAAWPALAERLAGPVAEIALTLSPSQIGQIREEVRERQAEQREKHLAGDADQRLQARRDRWQERLEHFLGPLTERQQALLAHGVAALPDSGSWWQTRHAWQDRFVDLIEELARTQPDAAQATERVREHLLAWAIPQGAQQQALSERIGGSSSRLVAEILAEATSGQLAHARDYLLDLAADFRKLAQTS